MEKVGTRCVKISLDVKLDARYRVVEVVHGVSPEPVINFDCIELILLGVQCHLIFSTVRQTYTSISKGVWLHEF